MSRYRCLISWLLFTLVAQLNATTDHGHEHSDADSEATIQPHKPLLKLNDIEQLKSLIQDLSTQHAPVSVHVRLVGFNGDGNQQISASEYELYNYLHTLPAKINSTVLGKRENLLVGGQVSFHVSKATSSVTHNVQAAVDAAVRSASENRPTGPEYLVEVPYTSVDTVLQGDLQYTKDDHFTIFILNLNKQSVKYAYKYSEGSCAGALWSGKRPYTWIDLTAGPLQYGPGPYQGLKGQVFQHSVPNLQHYNPEYLKKALLPDLSGLVTSAVQHLVWPPLQHAEVHYRQQVEIYLIHIHDTLLPGTAKVDVDMLQKELKLLQLGGTQLVTVRQHYIGFQKCDTCVAGYTRALKLRSNRAKGAALHMSEELFVDAMELHSWMAATKDDVYGDVGIHEYADHHGPLVIPVFLFDVNSPFPIMLDGHSQAMAFPGMVLALHTKSAHLPSGFVCQGNERWVDHSEISRGILGAAVQAGWGVPEISLAAGPLLLDQLNYLWSVGNDPTTFASNMSTLSYVQISAGQRNIVLLKLNETLSTALKYVEAVVKLADGRPLQLIFPKKQLQKFETELGLFQSRIRLAVSLLGARSYRQSFKQIEDAELDLHEVRNAVMDLHYDLAQHFVCKHTTHFYGWMFGAVGIFALAVALFAIRRVKESRVKDRWY